MHDLHYDNGDCKGHNVPGAQCCARGTTSNSFSQTSRYRLRNMRKTKNTVITQKRRKKIGCSCGVGPMWTTQECCGQTRQPDGRSSCQPAQAASGDRTHIPLGPLRSTDESVSYYDPSTQQWASGTFHPCQHTGTAACPVKTERPERGGRGEAPMVQVR